jgi:hypothetical protein
LVPETIDQVIRRRMSRRLLIKGGAVGALVLTLGGVACGPTVVPPPTPAGTPEPPAPQPTPTGKPGVVPTPRPGIRFEPVALTPGNVDDITVSPGHTIEVLLKWGDPILPEGQAFDPSRLTASDQEKQFGYNCDYTCFFPLPRDADASDHGLLWTNHEYTNPELMFPGYDAKKATRALVDYELAAHGGSVVELKRDGSRMTVQRASRYNRRITGTTPMAVSGPAAGHDWLKTSADPTGRRVVGMLNNCAGGQTPWGTVLTCEENFHEYFGNAGKLPGSDPRSTVHGRYGMPAGSTNRRWEEHHDRFDVTKEPNEAFRFGWVVEVDPHDPASTPVKRTALGRFRHEGATFAVSPSGRVAFYSGDDERFEYVYKFVTNRAWDPANREANKDLLDEGTLYAAKFDDDGTGRWLPLVAGQGPLTADKGFASQGDVAIKTRLAADAVGATKMDRPEDVQQNPVNKKIYMAMSNNNMRGGERLPGTDKANPRADNRWGHVLEVTETNDDVAATTFAWEMFLLCGDPADRSTYFAGFPKERVSRVAAPDNLNFDLDGNLWIATDGQPAVFQTNDAVHVVPTAGPERGRVQTFLTGVSGCELTGITFTPDNRTLFVAVQHPGEYGTLEKPISRWPDRGALPRPSVVQVWNSSGGRVGVTIPDPPAKPAAARAPT